MAQDNQVHQNYHKEYEALVNKQINLSLLHLHVSGVMLNLWSISQRSAEPLYVFHRRTETLPSWVWQISPKNFSCSSHYPQELFSLQQT